MNDAVGTVVVVPLTSTPRRYFYRVPSSFQGRDGDIAVDHIRSVDRSRLIRRLGPLDAVTSQRLADMLVEMFRY